MTYIRFCCMLSPQKNCLASSSFLRMANREGSGAKKEKCIENASFKRGYTVLTTYKTVCII
ncbi:hypothetical protein CW304_21310 [Bacillus sp. UFRGS-B20]|nr:hypothetical protein CW304_21310 [Bacillus sp. UFRGS-B20]